MRLFVAVRIDPEVARAMAVFSADLRTQVERMARSARITWVREEQLHITVRFVGHVDEAQRARIQDALTPAVAVDPFDVTAAGAGAFPPRGAPRVLWAGIAAGREALGAIERDVSARLAACGIATEDRPYRPHITLARVRDAAKLRTQRLFEGTADRLFGAWRVDAITLFESRPSPQGHQYVPLQSTHLRASI